MQQRSSAERRHHQRHEIELEVRHDGGQRSMVTRSTNISEGGVFLHTVSPQPVGKELALVIKLPDDEQIEVKGCVAHSIRGIGMGVEFVEFAADGQSRLLAFVAQLTRESMPDVAFDDD